MVTSKTAGVSLEARVPRVVWIVAATLAALALVAVFRSLPGGFRG